MYSTTVWRTRLELGQGSRYHRIISAFYICAGQRLTVTKKAKNTQKKPRKGEFLEFASDLSRGSCSSCNGAILLCEGASESSVETLQHTKSPRVFACSLVPHGVLTWWSPQCPTTFCTDHSQGSGDSGKAKAFTSPILRLFALSPCEKKHVRGHTRGCHGGRGHRRVGVGGQGSKRGWWDLIRRPIYIRFLLQKKHGGVPNPAGEMRRPSRIFFFCFPVLQEHGK